MSGKYEVGKWYGWNGGGCPVHPETVVEVVGFCDGDAYGYGDHQEASIVYWNDGSDIVAFRIIKEHKEPREFWVIPESGRCFSRRVKSPYAIHVREVIE